jgi:hypothetical protein
LAFSSNVGFAFGDSEETVMLNRELFQFAALDVQAQGIPDQSGKP